MWGFDCFARMKETVVHTQMWWVRNVWLWVWAVKEEKGPGASWGQLREGSSPQRGPKECQRWWLLSTVPRGVGLRWRYRDHLLQATLFIPQKDRDSGKGRNWPWGHLCWGGEHEIQVSLLQVFPQPSCRERGFKPNSDHMTPLLKTYNS